MSKDNDGLLHPHDEAVVELLLRTDRIVERYMERKGAMGEEMEFDKPGLTERLILAEVINQTSMVNAMGGGAGALSPDAIMGKLDALRRNLLEEAKAYVEEVLSRPRMAAVSHPPVAAFLPVDPPTFPVSLEPAKVHQRFEDLLLAKASLTPDQMKVAKGVLDLLLVSPEGNDLLQLMVYDAVIIKRGKVARKAGQPPERK